MVATPINRQRFTRGELTAIVTVIALLLFAATGLLGVIVDFIIAYFTIVLSLIAAAITLFFVLIALSGVIFILSGLVWLPLWLVSWWLSNFGRRDNAMREDDAPDFVEGEVV